MTTAAPTRNGRPAPAALGLARLELANPESIRILGGHYGREVTFGEDEHRIAEGESHLTPGETEALDSAARGENVTQAGLRLEKSPWTIRTQRNRAMARLGAGNIAQAVYIAAKRELI